MKITEKAVENQILEYLELRNCFPCKIERQGTFDRSKGAYRLNKAKFKRNGISDIMFFWKDLVYYCEVKTPEKFKYIKKHYEKLQAGEIGYQKTVTTQIDFIWNVREKGQIGFFCDSVERLRVVLEQSPRSVDVI